MKNKIRVYILDDSFPKLTELVDRGIFDGPIGKKDLSYLVRKADWKDESKLKELTSYLLNHAYVKQGWIEVVGYSNPEFCISDLDPQRKPDVIVYDWEYGSHPAKESERWLLEILKMTNAFVFVYSAFSGSVPPILNKKEFDEFAPRFQLFSKGSSTFAFTSEEFIYQYILSRVTLRNTIKVRGIDVVFKDGYLKDPRGILDLEAILGQTALLERLSVKGEISDDSIETMITGLNGHMFWDDEQGFLVATGFPLRSQSTSTKRVTYLEALRRFGLVKIKEAIETGFAKV